MGVNPETGAAAAAPPRTPASGQKRKRESGLAGSSPMNPIDLDEQPPVSAKKTKQEPEEKRLRRFRPNPPARFYDIYNRATTQRFYVLSRTRCGTADCPEEMLELAGSTGNVYTVVITRCPACDCPHARAGNQCKHLLYVLARVLRAPFHLVYQLALLSSELREIFANAPDPVGQEEEDEDENGGGTGSSRRRPVEGDCPICFEELVSGRRQEDLVWCRAACGQNVHRRCFEMWAGTKRRQQQAGGGVAGSEVTCPLCRTVWHGDEDMVARIKTTGPANAEGYVNVADQLGISTVRDTSTYSSWYLNPRRGYW